MARFVVYEVWTRARVITAPNENAAYDKGHEAVTAVYEGAKGTGWPIGGEDGLHSSNWHVVRVPAKKKPRGRVRR